MICLRAHGADKLSDSAQGGERRIWRVGANGHPRINKLHAIHSLLISFSLFCLLDSVLETLTEL